jgi:hypothetical protein
MVIKRGIPILSARHNARIKSVNSEYPLSTKYEPMGSLRRIVLGINTPSSAFHGQHRS